MMPDPKPGDRCRVIFRHGETVSPAVPCVVAHVSRGTAAVRLAADVMYGWYAGDTYRAPVYDLRPEGSYA